MPKPLLASEVMVEDRAPLEPWRGASRVWLLIAAASLAGLGLSVFLGVGLPKESMAVSFSAAAACALTAGLPFPYAARATLSAVLGLGLMSLGLSRIGPLAGLAMDGGETRDLLRLLVATTLPASLLVRARYPTYPATRAVLAVAVVMALPLLFLEGQLSLDPDVPWAARLAAGATAVVLLVSPVGFVGDGSMGHASPWAWLVLAVFPIGIAAREFTPLASPESGWLTYPATGTAMATTTILASLGVAQLLARVIAPRARARLRQRARPVTSSA
ncbi:MAG: hypothetical protein JW751_30225 [Polyangiaceae bacterium]|nr:hypothetical protein [Polyangiaceae bacterium]